MNMHFAVKLGRLLVCVLTVACSLSAIESKPDEPVKATTPAAALMLGKAPGDIRDDNGLKMKLVWCPPGEFRMGSPPSERNRKENEDQVTVTLTVGFWLGKFEVTQAEWKQVMETEPWKKLAATKDGAEFPATYISWQDAADFCRKITDLERRAGRLPDSWEYSLPTEAQWEYACRAGTQTRFSFGDDESKLDDYAWFNGNIMVTELARQVGRRKPNQWGLYDMHGNVCEWCRDIYTLNLPGGLNPDVKAAEKTGGSPRVFRGGGWPSRESDCRAASRGRNAIDLRDFFVGFRLALSSRG